MNVFALSRIFYIASVLPLQKSFIKKVETSIGKFLWSSTGRLLRVSLADIKNSRDNGGLGLTCLASKGKSLMLSQLLRLVRNGDSKTVGHMLVWLGKLLEDFLPHMQSITALPKTPSYFETLADTLTQARITDVVSMVNWKNITCKMIYLTYVKSLPETKIVKEVGSTLTETWRKLNLPSIPSSTREVLYLNIHNKLPTPERLFRVKIIQDPYCENCFFTVGAVINDREHYFCECVRVREVWNSIRVILNRIMPSHLTVSNLELITFPKNANDHTIVWIVGRYLETVWQSLHVNGSPKLAKEKIFGFLKFKYRSDQLGARHSFTEIVELS